MAIARGAGTEIIRSILLEDITDTVRPVIVGVQHHIYTVLSIIVNCRTLASAGNYVEFYIKGYDSQGGTTAQSHYILHQPFQAVNETFVWDNKFSFNGYEPVNFTGPMDGYAKQDAIADQANTGSDAQSLNVYASASCGFDITCTFIDQNNS